MNYKEKYEQALQRAKQFSEKPYLEDSKGIVEYIFPELGESEDEKVRKDIISLVDEFWAKIGSIHPEFTTHDKMIAWLEKKRYSEFELENEYWRGYDDCKKQGDRV